MRFIYVPFLFAISAFSNPTGASVQSGDVQISSIDGQTIHIQASDKAIIHWEDFSIAEQELTKFIQPGFDASVLNRVVGENISSILGKLEANGQVLLINPHGVIFGKDSSVETGGFTASTLDVLDGDFLLGKELLFKGSSLMGIANLGRIEARNGNIILAAFRVDNQGDLIASKGTCGIGASQEILLIPEGDSKIVIRPSLSSFQECGINHSGTIEALQVELKAYGSAYEHAVEHSGVIRAKGLIEKEGKVFLVADGGTNLISGEISSKNNDETGGKIYIFGEKIALCEKARLDASGVFGGGEILIGGDVQGSNPTIKNAEHVFVGEKVEISNRATEKGDGGKTVFWADSYMRMYGKVDAQGGESGGDGGFVEISGKKGFEYSGTTNRSAIRGNPGMLLLDPESDISIVPGAGAPTNGAFAAGLFTPTGTPSTISGGAGGTLVTELGLGNVTVQTSGPFAGPGGAGDIFVLTPITTGSMNTLTLTAARDINIPAGNSLAHPGNLVFNAGRDISIASEIDTPNISLNATQDFNVIGSVGLTRIPLSPGGILSVNIGRDLNIDSNTGEARLGNFLLNTLSLNVGRNVNLISGTVPSDSVINAQNPGAISNIFIGGDLNLINNLIGAVSGFDVNLSLPGNTFQVVGNVNATGNSFLTVIQGPSISTSILIGGNVAFINGAELNIDGPSDANTMTSIYAQNISFADGAFLNGSGAGNLVTFFAQDSIFFGNISQPAAQTNLFFNDVHVVFVVDHAFPTPPQIGPGAFIFESTARAFTSQPFRIFTASRAQNIVDGLFSLPPLFLQPFIPGPFDVDTAQEIWSTYYPSALGSGVPVTFFYKEPAAVLLNPIVQQSISVAQLEILRDFFLFDEILPMYAKYQVEIWERGPAGKTRVVEIIPSSMRLRNYGTNMSKQVGEILPE